MLAEMITNIRSSIEDIKPGEPFEFTTASTVRDRVWQGDLAITIVDKVPAEYVKKQIKQLVPGDTQGARHCLASLDGCEVYVPPDWNNESLDGPVVKCLTRTVVTHPTHGDVIVPDGFIFECTYQRDYDVEQKVIRRALD